ETAAGAEVEQEVGATDHEKLIRQIQIELTNLGYD
ncbi:unnamed protein product, partial [marine sediment metagenome]